jgi:hypothetical protein
MAAGVPDYARGAATWHKMKAMICTVFLALGFVQKMPPIDAPELVRPNPVCVRVKAVAKDGSKGQVVDVIWGSLLRKGDTFQLVERRETVKGTNEWYPHRLSQDSIVFMRPARDLRGTVRWAPSSYRIPVSRGQVRYWVDPVYPTHKDETGKLATELQVEGGILLRVDTPRKGRKFMTYAEVKAELIRARSMVGASRR